MNASALMSSLVSHALTAGLFDSANKHEPKAAPGTGLNAAIWVQSISPLQLQSGLDSTSARIEFALRIYSNMLAEPQDEIDPQIIDAAEKLMTAYSGDFTLGDSIAFVDLIGVHGQGLSAEAGYINVSGGMFRVMTITIPLIVNDAYTQTA